MSDAEIREAERRWRATGAEADAEALVNLMLRHGRISMVEVIGRLKRLEDAFFEVLAATNTPRSTVSDYMRKGGPVQPSEVLSWLARRSPEAPQIRWFRAGDRVQRESYDGYRGRSRLVLWDLHLDEDPVRGVALVGIQAPLGVTWHPRTEFTLLVEGPDQHRESVLKIASEGSPSEMRDIARVQYQRLLVDAGRAT